MASNESFKQAIKAYLDKRAEEDSLFAPKYANEKKSIDECCSYIMGEAMHHCVYANRYYRRSECLIMTAIVGEKHVETIEVNLKSFQIVLSRAVCNGTSEYHDRIIRLVEKNMSLIKKRIA